MSEILTAIITATAIVSLITALIYISEIPEMEEEYREKLKNLDKFTEDDEYTDG